MKHSTCQQPFNNRRRCYCPLASDTNLSEPDLDAASRDTPSLWQALPRKQRYAINKPWLQLSSATLASLFNDDKDVDASVFLRSVLEEAQPAARRAANRVLQLRSSGLHTRRALLAGPQNSSGGISGQPATTARRNPRRAIKPRRSHAMFQEHYTEPSNGRAGVSRAFLQP